MAMKRFDQSRELEFTQPVRQIVTMLVISGLIGVGIFFSYGAVAPVFLASPYLNGFIILVFIVGVAACFWQVLTLISSVSWIEGFALDRPGHEFVKAPGLLASLAAMLNQKGARNAVSSSSARSILDSVASRLDEARDITRYLINLLIFLGLLGTFYGLATSVPAVVDTIRSLAPEEGAESSLGVFDNLMSGLEDQLGGMGTAFGSSLLGLAGSLIVGLLDLLAGHGQNRFYRELEEWLSSITRITMVSTDADPGEVEQYALAELLEHSAIQLESLQNILIELQARQHSADERLDRLTQTVERVVHYAANNQTATQSVLESVHQSQSSIARTLDQALTHTEERQHLHAIEQHLERLNRLFAAATQEIAEGDAPAQGDG